LVADLASAASGRRWPVYAPAAVALGVRGVFSIPVRAGAARIGVLDLYRDRPGPLTGDELSDVLAYTDALLVLALDHQGGISPGVQEFLGAQFTERRAGVHQAAGMVSVQLDIGVTQALARLRAYAYAHDRRLAEVSADVVARRLSFRPGAGTRNQGRTGVDDAAGPYHNGNDTGNQDTGPLPGTDTTGEEGSE
jgi:hypothetical protein